MVMRSVVSCSILILLLSSVCHGASRSDFDAAYKQYLHSTDNKDWGPALESAELAYNLGKEVFGARNINTGNLAFNYGEMLNKFKRFDDAKPVLLSARKILKAKHGKKNAALADVYFELGKAAHDKMKPQLMISYFNRAIKLAASESAMERANFNLKIGSFASTHGGYARKFYASAYNLYLSEVGASDARTALAAFNLSKYALAKKEYGEARDLLQSSIGVFESAFTPVNRRMELIARAFIIEALEELGESEIATQHCRIIGSKTPAVPNADYLPVYIKPPMYPAAALRDYKEGWVVVEFSVDDNGFTRNHKIIESTSDVFEISSIAAVEKFRYAPRFENGVAISTDGVQNKLIYEIAE